MKLTSLASLGAIAAVLVFGVGYLTFGIARVDPFAEYTTASMVLTNSGSIGARSPILLSGVRVGEVTAVNKTVGGVEVDFRVEDRYRIPTASTVLVENLSTLGEPYIEFTPNGSGGPYLRSGQRVETRRIQMPLSIPDVARTVTDFLNQLDPQAINSLVATLHEGLTGLDQVIPQMARSTDLLAAALLARMPAIRTMLTDLQNIGGDMEWAGPSMTAAGPLWGQFGVRVSDIADAVARFVRIGTVPDDYVGEGGLIPFVDDLRAYLNEVGPDLAALTPVLQPLAAAATSAAPRLDISALITQALNATGADGAIHLNIDVK